MNKTDLHSSLLFLMIKLEEAKRNPMSDKNFVSALTEVLRYFRDNGELKKAYELQKDSLADLANSSWTKALKDYVSSKNHEDGVDAKFPDIDGLIKELASDEFIEKKSRIFLAIKPQSPPSYHSGVGIFSSKTINIINLNPMKN